jgi:uncharacterized protein (TIGR00290 family)
VILSWSGGKDCAMALHVLRGQGVEVAGLLTTVTAEYDRISMHGVRRELLERQAASLGLPLHVVEITAGAGNESYEERMREMLARFLQDGIARMAFGDLFLRDVRRYRGEMLARARMEAVFPLWQMETGSLARRFLDVGFRAVLVCVDTEQLGAEFAGRDFGSALLADLPETVDPCGENGEFHTFVHDGPIFSSPIDFRRGERVLRDGRFQYQDLLTGPAPPAA